ncbi:MAG: hypothetical protein ACLTG4_02015 [Oscillospiraceae bacterium]
MDQFDRSPEDVSFDLDAEEFSLESILDEYKDFQTDAPAPRPQPAYRSRPVTAEMIEEEEAEDAAAEDILMSTELDSALRILPEAAQTRRTPAARGPRRQALSAEAPARPRDRGRNRKVERDEGQCQASGQERHFGAEAFRLEALGGRAGRAGGV